MRERKKQREGEGVRQTETARETDGDSWMEREIDGEEVREGDRERERERERERDREGEKEGEMFGQSGRWMFDPMRHTR